MALRTYRNRDAVQFSQCTMFISIIDQHKETQQKYCCAWSVIDACVVLLCLVVGSHHLQEGFPLDSFICFFFLILYECGYPTHQDPAGRAEPKTLKLDLGSDQVCWAVCLIFYTAHVIGDNNQWPMHVKDTNSVLLTITASDTRHTPICLSLAPFHFAAFCNCASCAVTPCCHLLTEKVGRLYGCSWSPLSRCSKIVNWNQIA